MLVLPVRIELTTSPLPRGCSTTELRQRRRRNPLARSPVGVLGPNPVHRDGKAIGSVVTFVDISERMRVQAALRESEERFRAVFDGASIGIAIAELAGGKLSVNRAYQQMLGCSAEEMQDVRVFDDLTHPGDRWPDQKKFQKMLDGECEHLRMEKRYALRDGRMVWANVELSMLKNAAGEAHFVLGTAVDVT